MRKSAASFKRARFFRVSSLQGLLIIPFVLQLLAAVGLIGYWAFRSGQQTVENLMARLETEVEERINAHLDNYLTDTKNLNHLNVMALESGMLNPDNLVGIGQFFWKQTTLSPIGFVRYGSVTGEYAAAGVPETLDLPLIIAQVSPREYGDQSNRVFKPTAEGKPGPRLLTIPNYKFQTEAWYTQAIQAQKPLWTSVYFWQNPRADPLAISISSPVYSPDRRLIGVVAIEQRLSQISDFLARLNIGRSGRIFIMERDGKLIATSGQVKALTQVERHQTRLSVFQIPDLLIQATATQMAQSHDFKTIQQEQRFTVDLQGATYLAQVSPWQDPLGLDWLVVIVLPQSEFMEQIEAQRHNTFWLCLAALLVAIGVGFYSARQILEPIRRIDQSAEAIAAGDLAQVVEVGGVHELRTLSDSFNQMAARLQQAFAELAQANRVLESRVEQRTAQLQHANAEIGLLNQQLQSENLRMAAELNVSVQMQQMILPPAAEQNQTPELDVASYVESADEIGGDYFDLFRQDDITRIGIGDVTGHGLESGVIVLMTQTAVRTLQMQGETDPVRFFDSLNRTLYANVQRMNSDKTLTLMLLEYQAGQLKLAGQHEEVLLIRADGRIERIDTIDLGFPLALEEDITPFIHQVKLDLYPGDLVVLYTDGVTEAINPVQVQYGTAQLCTVAQQHRHQSAQEICQAIMASLRQHLSGQPLRDDLTILVLKQR